MEIKLLGAHNTESQTTRMLSVLVDGVLAFDAGGLTSSLSLAEQRSLKALFLTHQHYDHIRDVPALGMNLYLASGSIDVYSSPASYEILTTCLLNGTIYPRFFERPADKPVFRYSPVAPLQSVAVGDYTVLPVLVNHAVPAVGYQVTAADGKALFYTGDTGPGLRECWGKISPDLLIIEVTSSNEWERSARANGHFTPAFLEEELSAFRAVRGYLPQVVTVHMSPRLEKNIRAEVAAVAARLNCSITPGHEGMTLRL